jgi:hypothetical protein
LGGACVASACQPVVVHTGKDIRDLAIDGTHLYWALWSGGVHRMPLPSGPSSVLTTVYEDVNVIALGPANVYYLGGNEPRLWQVPLAGGAVTMAYPGFAPSSVLPHQLVADATAVYFYRNSTLHELMAWTIGSTTPVSIAQGLDGFALLALDATDVYYGTDGFAPPAELRRVSRTGGVPQTCAQMPENVNAIAVDDANVYWTTSFAKAGGPALMSVPKAGGPPAVLVTAQADNQSSAVLAVDDTYVYWAPPKAGTLVRFPKGGGPATTLFDVGYGTAFSGVVVNDTAIYASTWDLQGQILILAK